MQPGIYWHLVLVLFLAIFATQALAHIFVLLSNQNFINALVIGIGIFFIKMLLCNVFINLTDLHYGLQLLSNFSVTRFAFEALLLLQYGFGRCSQDQIQLILYDKSLHDSDYYHKIAMLAFNIILWRVLALWLLVRKSNPRKSAKQRTSKIQSYIDNIGSSAILL